MSQDRTEQPTPKRLKDAREKGQVARTKEAGQAGALVAAVLAIGWIGEQFMARLADAVARGILRMGERPTQTLDPGEATRLVVEAVATGGVVVAPVAVASMATVVALHVAQGGWVFASKALEMKWEKLNPAQGIKRLGLSTGGVELLRTIVAVAMISVLSYLAVRRYLPDSLTLARLTPHDAGAEMWRASSALIRQVAVGLVLLAGADFFVQRFQLRRNLRMTKQEVRDEVKNMEGNPEVKARVRRIQREMVRRRMLTATRTATVVITNPTHYAVALEYRRGAMGAPVVVAKGRGYLALRIKTIAREHSIPIVENVQLARALYASAEVGQVIPGNLFEAVAEVLAYLIRLKQLVL